MKDNKDKVIKSDVILINPTTEARTLSEGAEITLDLPTEVTELLKSYTSINNINVQQVYYTNNSSVITVVAEIPIKDIKLKSAKIIKL